MLAITLQYHYDCQPEDLGETVKVQHYVDNLMKAGQNVRSLEKLKKEATQILADANVSVWERESNLIALESDNVPNREKILGTQLVQERKKAGNSGAEVSWRNSTDEEDHT